MSDDPFGIRTAPRRTETAGPAGYLRTAPDRDALDVAGADLDTQRRVLQRYADAEGLGELTWFTDEDTQGADLDRIGLRRLITAVNKGEITHLLVYRMNRLASVRAQLVHLFDTYLTPQSVPLISVTEHIDTDAPRGASVIDMLRSFEDPAPPPSDHEAQIRSRQRQRELAESGAYAGGRIPYGYRRIESSGSDAEDRTLRIDPDEARVVRRIFDLRRDGRSLRAIASELNDDEILSPRGGTWYASTVKYVLSNETYFGYRTYSLDGQTVTQDLPHLQIVASPRD
ncbi:hypothetical protein CRI94_11970 [Longibacter salinarum]|uniref:Recombinase domain-containing protein n=1 Tax=Longibacter salinarum TaxID=1850348 RepID=A0A2A8CWG8_9BACT|nr:recombinase family protein [Longibacter salinarum]PEN12738.1 hypothetical protein CRI94_11970 [Longibacter salinarum]